MEDSRELVFWVALSFSSWKILFGANTSKCSFRNEIKYSFLCLLVCSSSSFPPEEQCWALLSGQRWGLREWHRVCHGRVKWGVGKGGAQRAWHSPPAAGAQGTLGHCSQTWGLWGSCLQHGPVVDFVPFEGGWGTLKLCLMPRVKAATLLGVAPESWMPCISCFALVSCVLEPCLSSLGFFCKVLLQ